jgi:hypothetical protein
VIDETVRQLRESGLETENELNELRRLPKVSTKEARKLLGPLADSIPTPSALPEFADPCPPGTIPDTRGNTKAAKNRRKRERAQATSSTPATTEATTTTITPAPDTVAPGDGTGDSDSDTSSTPVPKGCVAL